MKGLKRLMLLLVIVSVGTVVVAWLISRGAPGGVRGVVERVTGVAEAWVASQLQAVADDHLGPKLQFDQLEYVYPNTATITNARLVADGESIIEVRSMQVTMTEIPRRGQPVVIEAIELDGLVVRLLHRANDTVIGFDTEFIKSSGGGEEKSDGGSTKLSDVFAIRRLAIIDGTYEQRSSSGRLMVLDQLNLQLQSHPDSADPGRYEVDAVLERAPVLEAKWDGYFHLDDLVFGFDDSTLKITLDEERYENLPATLQEWLRDYAVEGRLAMSFSGTCPASSVLDSDLDLEGSLSDARSDLGDYELPIKNLRFVAQMHDRAIYVPIFDLTGLHDGHVKIAGQLALEAPQPVEATVSVEDVQLSNILPDREPPFKGRIDVNGIVNLDIADPAGTMSGTGSGAITEGEMVSIALLDGLMSVMSVGKILSGDDTADDTLTADLVLHGDRLDLDKLDLVCQSVAAHGEGEVYFTGDIDFRFNGGPLEKVQRSVPIIGDIARLVSDRVVTYRATGTLTEPTFKVLPLGVGSGEGVRDGPGNEE